MKLILETTLRPAPQNEKLKSGKKTKKNPSGIYIDPKYVKAWQDIEWTWLAQIRGMKVFDPFLKPVVGIKFGWPRMDVDAIIKPVLDSLAKIGVYENDKQVQGLSGVWRLPEDKLIVTVEEIVYE